MLPNFNRSETPLNGASPSMAPPSTGAPRSDRIMSIIGPDLTINGDLTSKGELRIDGEARREDNRPTLLELFTPPLLSGMVTLGLGCPSSGPFSFRRSAEALRGACAEGAGAPAQRDRSQRGTCAVGESSSRALHGRSSVDPINLEELVKLARDRLVDSRLLPTVFSCEAVNHWLRKELPGIAGRPVHQPRRRCRPA
jgi:hypothetical protein